jgi:hypothetical protein
LAAVKSFEATIEIHASCEVRQRLVALKRHLERSS